ncbi:hypothetical protein OC844_007786, partial [Tilletia horrida]
WDNAECMCATCEERGDGVFRLLAPTRHGPDRRHPDTSADLTMDAVDDVTRAPAEARRSSARIAKKPPSPWSPSTGKTRSNRRPVPSLPRDINAPATHCASTGTQHGVEAQLQHEPIAEVAMDVDSSDAPGPAPSASSSEMVAGANMGPRQPRKSARIASSKSSSFPSTHPGASSELAGAQDSDAPEVAMEEGSDARSLAPSDDPSAMAGRVGLNQSRKSARIALSKSRSSPSTQATELPDPELVWQADSDAPPLAMEGDSDAPASAPSADSSATAARVGLRLLQSRSSTRLANKSKSRSSLSSQAIALPELAVEEGSNAPEVATEEEDNDAPSSPPGPNPSVTIGDEDDLASATGTSMGLMQPRTSVRLAYKAKSKAEAATSPQQVKKSKSSLSEGVAKAHRQPAASTPRRSSQFLFGGTNYYATGSLCPPLGCFQGARRWPDFAEEPTSPPSRSSTPPLSPVKRAKKQLPEPESEPADSSWVLADALRLAEEEIADALRAWRKAARDKGIEFDGLEAVRRTIPRRGGDEGEFWQAGDVAGGIELDDASDCAIVEDAFRREAAYGKRVNGVQSNEVRRNGELESLLKTHHYDSPYARKLLWQRSEWERKERERQAREAASDPNGGSGSGVQPTQAADASVDEHAITADGRLLRSGFETQLIHPLVVAEQLLFLGMMRYLRATTGFGIAPDWDAVALRVNSSPHSQLSS